jgi:hypothetical protein
MHEGGIALGLQATLEATDLTHAQPQQAGCLHLAAFAFHDRVQHLQSVPFALAHLDPVSLGGDRHGSSLPGAKRTFLSR